ncbi:MAG: hypothetical protein AAF567_21920 [Actinomycetota bacterium]
MEGAGATDEEFTDFDVDAVERWFVHRGVPQAIFHYNASEDVLTRMVPYLVAMFLLGSLAGFGDRFTGWSQFAVAIVAFAILTAVALGVNRIRGRRLFALPDDVGIIEIAAFLFGAPLIAVIFGENAGRLWWQLLLLNVVLLVGGYVLATYGIFPMIRWGIREVGVQVRGIAVLLARSLPLLLLFATFLFLNAEMWQVAHDFTAIYYALTISLVLLPALLFIALRAPSEIAKWHRFGSWAEVDAVCARTDAPLPQRPVAPDTDVDVVPLDTGERRNFQLLMTVAQVVQMLLVALIIGAFFIGFGLLTVREETILQWTEATDATFDPIGRFSLFGSDIVVTWDLFAVSGFIAAISALQFAVSQISDELYREQFYASLESEIREVLAVRARYLEPLVASQSE